MNNNLLSVITHKIIIHYHLTVVVYYDQDYEQWLIDGAKNVLKKQFT